MESKEQIARLWDKISARIDADGGVLHRSSFEQEVSEWVQASKPTQKMKLWGWDVGSEEDERRRIERELLRYSLFGQHKLELRDA